MLAVQFPRAASFLSVDFGSLLGPFFFTLAFNLLFPTVVVSLVYEKEVRFCTRKKRIENSLGLLLLISISFYEALTIPICVKMMMIVHRIYEN
jgi:hypothetical protein